MQGISYLRRPACSSKPEALSCPLTQALSAHHQQPVATPLCWCSWDSCLLRGTLLLTIPLFFVLSYSMLLPTCLIPAPNPAATLWLGYSDNSPIIARWSSDHLPIILRLSFVFFKRISFNNKTLSRRIKRFLFRVEILSILI